jgi:hypothetical protein
MSFSRRLARRFIETLDRAPADEERRPGLA